MYFEGIHLCVDLHSEAQFSVKRCCCVCFSVTGCGRFVPLLHSGMLCSALWVDGGGKMSMSVACILLFIYLFILLHRLLNPGVRSAVCVQEKNGPGAKQ